MPIRHFLHIPSLFEINPHNVQALMKERFRYLRLCPCFAYPFRNKLFVIITREIVTESVARVVVVVYPQSFASSFELVEVCPIGDQLTATELAAVALYHTGIEVTGHLVLVMRHPAFGNDGNLVVGKQFEAPRIVHSQTDTKLNLRHKSGAGVQLRLFSAVRKLPDDRLRVFVSFNPRGIVGHIRQDLLTELRHLLFHFWDEIRAPCTVSTGGPLVGIGKRASLGDRFPKHAMLSSHPSCASISAPYRSLASHV